MMIKDRIREDMKTAMRAHDAASLSTIRLLLAAIKQREVDEQIDADDAIVLQVIAKMVKQRRDSVEQYLAGGRTDLAEKESAEIKLLEGYLPQGLTDDEVAVIIDQAIAEVGATGMQAMGKVMGLVKAKVAGRADLGKVSALIKARLSA
ncbi:MAG: GatB/YqeY domain-containing protein [Sutterella sp.]|nr:GatB/YqeY domain-containing protein [Sutterella sp.]